MHSSVRILILKNDRILKKEVKDAQKLGFVPITWKIIYLKESIKLIHSTMTFILF